MDNLRKIFEDFLLDTSYVFVSVYGGTMKLFFSCRTIFLKFFENEDNRLFLVYLILFLLLVTK